MRHRFRYRSRHGSFSFTKNSSQADQRASQTIAIKPELKGERQLDEGIDDTLVLGVRAEILFALIVFQHWPYGERQYASGVETFQSILKYCNSKRPIV
jgi:hypothetical protein